MVYGLVALNIILFLYNGQLSPSSHNPLSSLVLIPAKLTGQADIGTIPAWMTIFTSMFLHGNWLHVLGNMLYLWIFGNNIEDVLGHFKFLAFYLLAGTAAALAQVFISPYATIPMVGASGAIAGVLGAYLVLFPRARIVSWVVPFYVFELPASIVLGFWIIIQLFNSLFASNKMMGGVAYAAHIGGFAAGVAMILLFGGRKLLHGRRPVEYGREYE